MFVPPAATEASAWPRLELDAEDDASGTRPGKKDKWRERLAGKKIQEFCAACNVLGRNELFAREMAGTLL